MWPTELSIRRYRSLRWYVHVSDEVQHAVQSGRPVVALESTIISHGMPYPQNVEMAHEVEAIVREHGATPATIAVIDGECTVGIDASGIESLASRKDVHKATTRDLRLAGRDQGNRSDNCRGHHAPRCTRGDTGLRDGRNRRRAPRRRYDVRHLGRPHRTRRDPVAVVCAGVKSILDIALTLEYLETAGVPVIVIGSDEFPAFYSRSSGHGAPRSVDDAAAAAAVLDATWGSLKMRARHLHREPDLAGGRDSRRTRSTASSPRRCRR